MATSADKITSGLDAVTLKNKAQEESYVLMIGKNPFTFEPDEPDEELQARAAQELRETPQNVEEGLKRLRELLKGEPDLKVPTDKEHLQKFMRPCKWYPDSAFELMKRFYKYRINNPKYCENLTPSNERIPLTCGVLTPLPKRTKDDVRVILIEGGKKWKPKEASLDSIYRGVILYLEAAMAEPKSQVAGVRVIIDLEGMTLSHATNFTPSFAASVVEFVQRCLPCRLKGIHIINEPFIFNMVFALFKPFLHEKLRKRIIFHGTDRASLLKYIDATALPQRYGGNLEFPYEPVGEPVMKYLLQFEDDFKLTNSYGYEHKKK